jgi:NTE family protein
VPIDGLLLVDGGLVNPVPVEVVRELGAEYIIAVDISPSINHVTITRGTLDGEFSQTAAASIKQYGRKNAEAPPNIFEVILGSINIMEASIKNMRMKNEKPDIIISPDIFDVGLFEFHKHKLGVAKGEEAAKGVLNKIDRFVKRRERALIKVS